MKKYFLTAGIALSMALGCGSLGEAIKEAAEKEKANRKLPAGIIGTWVNDGYLKEVLEISENNFSLKVYNRQGKLSQTFAGPLRVVDLSKNFIGPAIAEMTQDGKDMSHILKNGVRYKPFYFKDLAADSVKIYMHNGYADEKNLRSHDEDSREDRRYSKFTRGK